MEEYKIVYDVDDCLLDTNGYVCDTLGINILDMSDWELNSLPNHKDKIFDMYRCGDTYRFSEVFAGIEFVRDIEDVYLHTHCITPEAAIAKQERLIELGFRKDRIILDFCEEKLNLARFILVDDCFNNIKNSTAKFRILINKPWNIEETSLDSEIIRVDSLLEANEIVAELLKEIYG